MSITSLDAVLKIFRGADPTPEEQAELANEVMLMTLARATSADSNIKNIEVETVQAVLKQHTGQDFSSADVRVAAQSKIFESAPLDKYLASASRKLTASARADIARSLTEIIEADGRVSTLEIDFFNMFADAMNLSAAEIAGLMESS